MTAGAKHYAGDELALFANAAHWKRYWSGFVLPYLGGVVLEVGAGLGGTTRALAARATFARWVCLEPDPVLAASIPGVLSDLPAAESVDVVVGTLEQLSGDAEFDAVLYIDTLEHIADDRDELSRVRRALRPCGHLIVLAPAHNLLFSPFDRAIGHCRRYDKRSLRATVPNGLTEVRLIYLDTLGLALSLTNRLLLRQRYPTEAQVLFWDRRVVPVSRFVDRLTLHRLGKSILGIWRRD